MHIKYTLTYTMVYVNPFQNTIMFHQRDVYVVNKYMDIQGKSEKKIDIII